MIRCGRCGRILDDPNRIQAYERCAYCDDPFCSPTCAEEHAVEAHAGEAIPSPEEEEERPSA
jgi:hypothetical protein